MEINFLNIAKTFLVFGVISTFAFSFQAFAEERYICATVAKILETESEDCLYFIVKGDFTLKGNKEKRLSVCIDSGNDAGRDSELVYKSFEQKKTIYILIDGSSVRKIQNKCP